MSGIGVLNEKSLHKSLKEWYSQPGDRFEVKSGRYVIDIVRDGVFLEIQTGNFSSIKTKLENLTEEHKIRLIHPIAKEKWIVKPRLRPGLRKRKSPKRGCLMDLFYEMVYIPQMIGKENFSLEVLMIKEREIRKRGRSRRKRGWVTDDRQLVDIVDRVVFEKPSDWKRFLPNNTESFTTKDIAKSNRVSVYMAQKIAYCLRNGNVIECTGKKGRANLYKLK